MNQTAKAFNQRLQAAIADHQAGQLDAAARVYRQLLEREPAHPDVLHMLGLVAMQQGKSDKALQFIDRALAQKPTAAAVLSNKASACLQLGDFETAIQCAWQATQQAPTFFNAWINLGLGCTGSGQHQAASEAFGEACRLKPGQPQPWLEALFALLRAGDNPQAERHVHTVETVSEPASQEALYINVAKYAEHVGQDQVSDRLFRHALTQSGFSPTMQIEWARALLHRARVGAALDVLEQMPVDIAELPDALMLRSLGLQRMGESRAAVAGYRQLLQAYPDWPQAHSNLLIALQYDAQTDAQTIYQEHLNWARLHLRGAKPKPAAPLDPRPLRIAWLSTGFNRSPVSIFFREVSAQLPRKDLAHLFYHDSTKHDDQTKRFRQAADVWRETATLDHRQLADQIRADDIHVVVEMNGHGPGNRLRALDLRPAPLQISWLDYFHSTGANCMDVFLADDYLVPEHLKENFTERVVYLESGRLCYSIPAGEHAPGPVNDDPVVLCCFNRLSKLNDSVLKAWGEIMTVLPRATLQLRAVVLGDEPSRQRFAERARAAGLPMERVQFAGGGAYEEILDAYRGVDIALDPFPFSGCATTCDALWMGVPVVTLCGETMAARQSAALLSRIDLDDLVAHDESAYVRKVIELAGDVPRRRKLRGELRALVESRLGNAQGFATQLCHTIQTLYRGMHG